MKTTRVGMVGERPKLSIKPAKPDSDGLTPEEKAKARAKRRAAAPTLAEVLAEREKNK
jgi:hypothetical protein